MLSADRSWPGGRIASEKNNPTLRPIAAMKPATFSLRHPTRCGRSKPSARARRFPRAGHRPADEDRQRHAKVPASSAPIGTPGLTRPKKKSATCAG